MEYFKKLEKNPYEDLFWNVPEMAKGTANVVGGNTLYKRWRWCCRRL